MPEIAQPDTPTALNRIRVETALSRFPLHRLAKKGTIGIELQRVNELGEADFRWEVTYNVKHGQPGPLAYKIDTLVVNRRLDEARRPLPEVIKLGSLSTICIELGLADSGSNIGDVKRALHQNASAYITAKIRYKQKNGRERWGEIGYTRYSVVFTGEALPDGEIADAVYVLLNASYRDLLNQVEVRPLDYDYLVELAPGPQRLYELLSFPMYGAISNGRARAKLIYSEYCLCAPQIRYFDFDHVKKQMYKVHVPHRESGYIAKIDYEEMIDREGKPDWEILYTPGPKAFTEHQAFTRRTVRHVLPAAPVLAASSPTPMLSQQRLSLDPQIDEHIIAELGRRGISERRGQELLEALSPGQEVLDQIEWIDAIIAKAPAGKFLNPPGLYIAIIRDNVTPPPNFVSSRKRRLIQDAQQAADAKRARRAQLEMAYEEYQRETLDAYIAALPAAEYRQMIDGARRQLKRTYTTMHDAQLEELAANQVRAQFRDSEFVPMLPFEEFCKRKRS